MRFSKLLEALPEKLAPSQRVQPADGFDPVIRGICYDSRRVTPGDLFVALPGSEMDGHDFIDQAVELGAAAALVERAPTGDPTGKIATAVVQSTRRALAPMAAHFFGHPSQELNLIGITGTNGKTTSSYLIHSILEAKSENVGLIGTVQIRFQDQRITPVNTTPESLDLQRILRAMCTAGTRYVVMEVSSHGLKLGRVEGCRFGVTAFTNLSQDHLDFHDGMEDYLASKAQLFAQYLEPEGHAVVHIDDPASASIIRAAQQRKARVIRCSRRLDSEADIRLISAQLGLRGTQARVMILQEEVELTLPLAGHFNLDNLLVACGVATALQIDSQTIQKGVLGCSQVPGRMELVQSGTQNEPTVIVDYAHTPDAVNKLLSTIAALGQGRLITVFGCGGDRDSGKRPLMAEAVARHSNLAVATSDNPRTEDPIEILRDMEAGLGQLNRTNAESLGRGDREFAVIPDRREAIRLAISIANADDQVVLAGKGHEDYQIIGTEKLPFDDRKEARIALKERGSA